MKFSHIHLEYGRHDPARLKSLKSPGFGGRGRFSYWQDAVGHFHKNGNDPAVGERHIEEKFATFKPGRKAELELSYYQDRFKAYVNDFNRLNNEVQNTAKLMDMDISFGNRLGTGCASDPDASSGNCAFAAGSGSVATGDGAVAVSSGDASGNGSFAAGGTSSGTSSCALTGSTASGLSSFAVGSKSKAQATNAIAIGTIVEVASASTNSIIIGEGLGSSPMNNDEDHSIMMGMNSDEPTMFIEGAAGTSGSIGRVGIGTTGPEALLHVEAASSGTEEIARFTVGGVTNTTNYFRIQNTTGTSGDFGAMLKAANNTHSDGPTLMLKAVADADAVSGDDDPQAAIMQFDSRYSGASSGDSIKPLFVWTENNNGNSKMIIDSWGNVGIGENSPAGALEVKGTVFVDYSSLPAGSITGGGPPATDYIVGIKSTTGQLLNLGASSIQFKEEVENIEFDKEAFLQLRPVDFKWKEFYGGHMDVGLVAQEVEETFPALASFAYKRTFLPNGDFERDSLGNAVEDTSQLEAGGVRYHKLAVYLLALAKDQQLEIDALQTQTETLITMVQNCCGEPSYRMGDLDENGMVVKTGNGVEEYVLLNNDPNPFSDYTDIHYAKDDCQNCEIVITDINGRIVKRIQLATSNGTVRVYASEIGRGMFIYSLIKDGQVVRSERMASTK